MSPEDTINRSQRGRERFNCKANITACKSEVDKRLNFMRLKFSVGLCMQEWCNLVRGIHTEITRKFHPLSGNTSVPRADVCRSVLAMHDSSLSICAQFGVMFYCSITLQEWNFNAIFSWQPRGRSSLSLVPVPTPAICKCTTSSRWTKCLVTLS